MTLQWISELHLGILQNYYISKQKLVEWLPDPNMYNSSDLYLVDVLLDASMYNNIDL